MPRVFSSILIGAAIFTSVLVIVGVALGALIGPCSHRDVQVPRFCALLLLPCRPGAAAADLVHVNVFVGAILGGWIIYSGLVHALRLMVSSVRSRRTRMTQHDA